jgi:hypothetical protein
MKQFFNFRIRKTHVAASLLFASGIWGFAPVAMSEEASMAAPAEEISDGRVINLDGGISIAPVPGWKIERKSMGMGLVMKEVVAQPQGQAVDYSKPIFARNITVTTLPEARYMDEKGLEEAKADITKMMTRDPSLKDFQITDAKAFDYKGKNDGFVIFSQLTVNNFPMTQMQVLVSGAKKSYLLTYSDLTANFTNPASYDAAWKSMTSISVEGVAPRRFEKEAMIGGSLVLALMALVVPFVVARLISARRIRKLADELQYDWDHGAVKTDADYDLSDINPLEATQPVRKKRGAKSDADMDLSLSLESSISAISTRHSRFA